MKGPNFFIVGAQKAGTTSLHAMLAAHPDVFMTTPKEPGYFIRGFDDAERWQTLKRPIGGGEAKSLANVRQGIFTSTEYAALFAGDEAQAARLRGEASTPYLPSPHAAHRIRETYPEARIVVALRDPVERAYSAWGYNLSRGNENAARFEDAIAKELSGQRDDWIWGSRYLYSGLYARHLQLYFDHFERERILVLKFEHFRSAPEATYGKLCDFLGISPQALTGSTRENATVQHSNAAMARARAALTTPGALKSVASAIIPKALARRMRKRAMGMIDRFGEKPQPLSQETREQLAAYFARDCETLTGMIDFDISDWTPLRAAPTKGDASHG